MKTHSSGKNRSGFMMMEVLLALMIFAIVATSFTRGINSMWRNTSFVKEELVITQIIDSALQETLYLQQLEEGSTEIYIAERDIDLETQVIPLELETQEGNLLQQMWEIRVIARFKQDGFEQERTVRGWRYLPLYKP
ncbi:MAG: type II secretory pathway pseudopilin PulG [Paracoccaceae bacterium]|jgi:type II secretory pathway pseudopilin PulG